MTDFLLMDAMSECWIMVVSLTTDFEQRPIGCPAEIEELLKLKTPIGLQTSARFSTAGKRN